MADERHLKIFVDWYNFGGMNRGLSLSEVLTMPATMRKDFAYFLAELGRAKAARRELEKGKKA